MCGIVGFSGPKGSKFDLLKIKFLMFYNSIERGLHSTGIYTPKTGTIKAPYQASTFFGIKEFKSLKKDNMLIGHVRHATVGDKTAANAHPFTYGRITGCHNGTLVNWAKLIPADLPEEAKKELNVDSKVLVKNLALDYENGVKGDEFNILNSYSGAAAMLFHNKDTEVLYAYRDRERTLYYGIDKDCIYISSIPAPLEDIGIPEYKIHLFEENYVYAISNGKILSKTLVRVPKKLDDLISSSAYSLDCAIAGEVRVINERGDLQFIKSDRHTGITSILIKSQHVTNYNVKVTNNWVDGHSAPSITPGAIYYAHSEDGSDRIVIRDNWGKDYSLPLKNISNMEYIPIKGHYVEINNDLYNKDSHGDWTIPICKNGEIMEVIEHTPFTDVVRVKSLLTGAMHNIYTYWLYPAGKVEIQKFVDAHPELFDNEDMGKTQNLQKEFNFDKVEDCCGFVPAKEATEDDVDGGEEEQEFKYIETSVYLGIIDAIQDEVKDIGLNINNPDLASAKLVDLVDQLEDFKDIEAVNEINM